MNMEHGLKLESLPLRGLQAELVQPLARVAWLNMDTQRLLDRGKGLFDILAAEDPLNSGDIVIVPSGFDSEQAESK